MTSSGGRAAAGLLALALALAGCTSTTSGKGNAATPAGASTSHDFPSTASTPPGSSSAPAESDSASAPASRGPSVHPVPSSPLKTVTVHASGTTTYVVKIWADVANTTCFDHAFGQQMIAFLIRHPCGGLHRYLGTTTVHGNPVGFAESVTSFAGTAKDPYVNSNQFTQLEKADGTGSISDLLREGYRLPAGPPAVPPSEAFNVIGQDNGVTVWDAWYLSDTTPTNDPALVQMTQDIFLQF